MVTPVWYCWSRKNIAKTFYVKFAQLKDFLLLHINSLISSRIGAYNLPPYRIILVGCQDYTRNVVLQIH